MFLVICTAMILTLHRVYLISHVKLTIHVFPGDYLIWGFLELWPLTRVEPWNHVYCCYTILLNLIFSMMTLWWSCERVCEMKHVVSLVSCPSVCAIVTKVSVTPLAVISLVSSRQSPGANWHKHQTVRQPSYILIITKFCKQTANILQSFQNLVCSLNQSHWTKWWSYSVK